LYGSENLILTVLKGRRIEAAEMKTTKVMTTYAAIYRSQAY